MGGNFGAVEYKLEAALKLLGGLINSLRPEN